MYDRNYPDTTPREPGLLMDELLKTQLALGESAANTSQFLQFALKVCNENLEVIRIQLDRLRDLAAEMDRE